MKKKMQAGKVGLIAAALGAVMYIGFGTRIAWGEAAELEEYNLPERIVTATRTEKSFVDTPANVEVITDKELINHGFTNAFQAVTNLAQAGGLGWQEDGSDYGGMMSRIRIRGIDNGTLVLVDGLPVNFGNASALNSIPLDQIDRIEVVKGAGSVLYGPQAMGGVVNVITKKPRKGQAMAGKGYGSFGNRYKDVGIEIKADGVNFGGKKTFTRDLNNVQRPGSGGTGNAMDIKGKQIEQLFAAVRAADDLTVTASRTFGTTTFYTGKYNNYQKSITKISKINTAHNTYSILYDSKENGWKAGVSYVTMDIFSNVGTYSKNNYYYGYDLTFDVQKKLNIRDARDSLLIGATIGREYWKVDSPPYNVFEDNGRNSYSLYESYDRQISGKFRMIFGLREYWLTKSKYQARDFQWLPQLQGIYKLNDSSSLYFNVGRSFQMPTLSSGFYKSNNYVVNPGLKPQSSWTYEIGYKYEHKKTIFSADLFYMTARDKIQWSKTADGKNIQTNADNWKNYGLELNVNHKLNDRQEVYCGLTLQNPQAKSEAGDYKTKAGGWSQDEAKIILSLGTTYHRSKFSADARIFSYLNREPAYYLLDKVTSPNPTGKGTYPDHNLRNSCNLTITLTYKPTVYDTFRLTGRNLLNRDDVINYDEYYATPANYFLTYERCF